MCGRYTLSRPEEIAEHFEFSEVRIGPCYNAAPTQMLPIVYQQDSERNLSLARWGFPATSLLINARSETVHKRPSFSEAFRRRRCLVPADGFFEWEDTPSGKQPHLFKKKDDSLFSFAGLWQTLDHNGEQAPCFTILTCPPNQLVRKLHDRMPVILPSSQYDSWLGHQTRPTTLLRMLQPFPAEKMKSFPVSRAVNRADDSPELLKPVEKTRTPSLFD